MSWLNSISLICLMFQLENKSAPVHTGRPHKRISDIEEFAKRLLDEDTEIFEESECSNIVF
mgnify:FL=1